MCIRFLCNGSTAFSNIGLNRWQPSLRGTDTDRSPAYLLTYPEPAWIDMDDTGRSWSSPYQDIEIYWGETVSDGSLSVGGTATGYTVYVNGTPFTPTYRDGSGTSIWTIRITTTVKNGDVVGVSYDSSVGASVAAADSLEIVDLVRAGVENDLTKRVRFILCNSLDANVTNEAVKAALLDYASNTVTNDQWMAKTDKATVTTDGSGQFDMRYTGTAVVGDSVFCAVIRTVESMVVAATIT